MLPPRSGRTSSVLASASALALALASCHSNEQKPSSAAFPRVRVERAQRGGIDEVVTLTGLLAAPPGRDVKLGALVPGRLARVNVAEGDTIKSGDVLAEIEAGPMDEGAFVVDYFTTWKLNRRSTRRTRSAL